MSPGPRVSRSRPCHIRITGRSAKITAVVATSDVMALACMEAAEDLDIEVPRKLSIVGFDDIPEAVQAGLTTIRQPMVEKGIVAAKLIIAIVNDPDHTVDRSAGYLIPGWSFAVRRLRSKRLPCVRTTPS
jgi:DNA-binding LacI/PurR family transcriptional regulator